MNELKITIKGKEFIIKQSFRSYLLYEEMTGHQISDISTMKDMLTLLYCTLKGCNVKSWEYNFDDFIDIIDEDPEIFTKFNDFNSAFATSEKKVQVKV
jgi:hypothetical protein